MARTRDKKRAIDYLRRAVRLLSRRGGWTQGSYARPKAYNGLTPTYCAVGSICHVAAEDNLEGLKPYTNAEAAAFEAVQATLKEKGEGRDIEGWNDYPTRKKSQVIDLMTKAIERLEAEVSS